MHVQDFTDTVLLRELARRYPPQLAKSGMHECVIRVVADSRVVLAFDTEAFETVLHPIPASER